MKRNRIIQTGMVALFIMTAISAQAAIVFNFDKQKSAASRTYTFRNLNTEPNVKGGTISGNLNDAKNLGSEYFTITVTAVTNWNNAEATASGDINAYFASRAKINWSGNISGIGPDAGSEKAFDIAGEALIIKFDLSGLSALHQASFKLTGIVLKNVNKEDFWGWAVVDTSKNALTTSARSLTSKDFVSSFTKVSPPVGNGDQLVIVADTASKDTNNRLYSLLFDIGPESTAPYIIGVTE